MSGTITVQNIQGPTTGSNANKVIVPSGHNLIQKNNIIQFGSYTTGYGAGARNTNTSTSFITLNINGTGQIATNTTKPYDDVIGIPKMSASSHLEITMWWPFYIVGTGDSGVGIRCQGYSSDSSINSGNAHLVDLLPNGYAHGWGASGYGDLDFGQASTNSFTWTTRNNSNYRSAWKSYVGEARFYWEVKNWSSSDTSYWIDYDGSYPKYAHIQWIEVEE